MIKAFRQMISFFQKLLFTSSIQQTLKNSYMIIIVMMIITPVISLTSSWSQTARYDLMITNVSKTNQLNQIVTTDVTNEIWDIVAGNISFAGGIQYEILDDINTRLLDIMQNTDVRENRRLLEVAGRAMKTMTDYVDVLGNQIKNQFLVTENEKILDEIRGVADLVSDILKDFIVLEIESATRTNEEIKRVALILSALQILTVMIAILFSIYARRSVVQNINEPINKLEKLSTKIASGDFSVQVDLPGVQELDHLTENLNIMAGKIQELIKANVEEQKNLQKSEMKALQAQITPHFLYNTLDTIVWLAEGKQYEQVISVTRDFSSFFRTALNRGRDWISVKDELKHIKNYLSIQKVRYRDILEYELDIDPSMDNKAMLKLLLQPLVENALYHGIKNKRGLGKIMVKTWTQGTMLCFQVDDNGVGMTPERLKDVKKQIFEKEQVSGDVYGLFNVVKRLSLYYNQMASLEISSVYKEGTTVVFRVPETDVHV